MASRFTCDGRQHTVAVHREAGAWSVYVDGRRLVDRESFAVADRVRANLLAPGRDWPSEADETAESIRRWLLDALSVTPAESIAGTPQAAAERVKVKRALRAAWGRFA